MATPYAVRSWESWFVRSRPWWRTNLTHNTFGPLLFLLAMGGGLGGLVGQRHPAELGGVPYGEFVAPGLLVAATMQAAVGASTWPVLGALKWQRTYHAMVATPLRAADVYLGHLMQMGVEISAAAVCFTAVALVLGYSPRMLLALPVAMLTGVAFAAPIAAWAIGRRTDSEFSVLYRLGVIPLFMFSGVFFPLATLPDALAAIVRVTPLWQGVALARAALGGGMSFAAGVAHLGYLVALLIVGVTAGRRTFAKALLP